MGIFEKFKIGLKKSATNITTVLKEIIIKKEIDDKTLDNIEDFLVSSDVGIDAASEIRNIISVPGLKQLRFCVTKKRVAFAFRRKVDGILDQRASGTL